MCLIRKKHYLGDAQVTVKQPNKVDVVSNGKNIVIEENVAYWWKANAIHAWFVNNCQDGNDDCRSYDVETEQLKELLELCKKAVETKDTTLLPTCDGFFFGSQEYDEEYWADLQDTINILSPLIDDESGQYCYCSSW